MARRKVIYTVGHSSREWEEFVELVRAHGVGVVVDVRRFPGSRKWPWFGGEAMRKALPGEGMGYVWMEGLGGRRKAREDSPNLGWRNDSFRGYADYMMTGEFREALGELEKVAKERPAAIMCSESVPWRCHRSLIADALVARGWEVRDIMSATSAKEHKLPAWSRVEGKRVWYPGEAGLFGEVESG